MRKRRDDGPSSSWRRPGNPRWPARRVLCLRQRPLATRCDLLERYKWSHNVGRWEEGVASTNAAPPQRGPKLRASTVSGLGDGPGRAAGLVLDATWQVLTQVPLGGGVLASGLHALFMGTSPTPTFTSASSSGRSAVRSRRPQPPPSPPGLTVTPTHSSHPPRPARDRRDRRPDRSCGPPTPTRGSAAAGDPTRRRARAGPPHAPMRCLRSCCARCCATPRRNSAQPSCCYSRPAATPCDRGCNPTHPVCSAMHPDCSPMHPACNPAHPACNPCAGPRVDAHGAPALAGDARAAGARHAGAAAAASRLRAQRSAH